VLAAAALGLKSLLQARTQSALGWLVHFRFSL
jgi:hypothetical protein